MSDDTRRRHHRRRSFLQALGVAGFGTAVGAGTAAGQADSGEPGSYHRTLRNDLTNAEGPNLPPGEFVYGTTERNAIDAFTLTGPENGTETDFPIDSDSVPISLADRIEVTEEPENSYTYSYQGFVPDGRSFEVGDVLLGVAYVRSETEGARAQANFKYRYRDTNGETAYQSGGYVRESGTVEPTDEWTRYYFPIEIGEKPEGSNYEPYMEFWTGWRQTIEFAGMAVIDYGGTDVAVDDLPAGAVEGDDSLLDYEGREEGAQWRRDARERIDEVRKADVEVVVVDGEGNAIPDATVTVEQREHAFDFGSAVRAGRIVGDGEADRTYRETFLDDFNKAVLENSLKYPSFLGPWGTNKETAEAALDWLAQRDVPTRGHYLLWEQYTAESGGGMAIENPESRSAEELHQLLLDRITSNASDVGDRVTEWDMHNHPVWQSTFRDRDGITWENVREWWEAADDATDAELYTNEMGNVAGDFFRSQHREFVQRLIDTGAPIDGIGFMGHTQLPEGNVTPPKEVLSTYDSFEETGLPILITEFDVQIGSRDDAEQVAWQRDFLRDFMIATFSHEAVEGVMSWGFWAEEHWRPTAAYYDADWSLRPHGETYMRLVFDEWWTRASGTTGEDGTYATRAFKGEHTIAASAGELTGSTTTTLDDDGSVTVEVSPGVEPVVGSASPTDPDGDGRYEDVDGDGDRDYEDVVEMFDHFGDDAVRTHPDAYDFNGNGRLDFDDVVELFRSIGD